MVAVRRLVRPHWVFRSREMDFDSKFLNELDREDTAMVDVEGGGQHPICDPWLHILHVEHFHWSTVEDLLGSDLQMEEVVIHNADVSVVEFLLFGVQINYNIIVLNTVWVDYVVPENDTGDVSHISNHLFQIWEKRHALSTWHGLL